MSDHHYRIVIRYDKETSKFVARAPELTNCIAEGDTREAAIAAVNAEVEAQLQNMSDSGSDVPIPLDEADPTGELNVSLPVSLHRELIWHARLEEVEVPELASALLSGAIERKLMSGGGRKRRRGGGGSHADNHGNKDSGGGRGRRGRGRNYHKIMDDRANFIEYVRGLEGSGGRHGNKGGGGGGGRKRGRNRESNKG